MAKNEIEICIKHPVGKPQEKTYSINNKVISYNEFKELKHADKNGNCYAQIGYYNCISNHEVIQILTLRKYNMLTKLFKKPF